MTNTEIYKKTLNESEELVLSAIEQFSDVLVNLAMSGEYSGISDLFENGDELVLDVADFLNSTDRNIQNIIKILNCLRDVQDQRFNG